MTTDGSTVERQAASTPMPRAYRYAVYFAPNVEQQWWAHASHWLGRCAVSQQMNPQPLIAGVSAKRFAELTEHPRRYGFHATMKAPFVLASQYQPDELIERVNLLCREVKPFVLPRLQVALLDQFLALVPERSVTQVTQLEEQCVKVLNDYAEPLGPEELSRRRSAGLSSLEDALLLRWGYPYVLERFRFHCSLTGSLTKATRQEVIALTEAAHQHFDQLPLCVFDSLAIFVEPTRGADFVLLQQCPLLGRLEI
jgi:putative phosphonate metabolism protein